MILKDRNSNADWKMGSYEEPRVTREYRLGFDVGVCLTFLFHFIFNCSLKRALY